MLQEPIGIRSLRALPAADQASILDVAASKEAVDIVTQLLLRPSILQPQGIGILPNVFRQEQRWDAHLQAYTPYRAGAASAVVSSITSTLECLNPAYAHYVGHGDGRRRYMTAQQHLARLTHPSGTVARCLATLRVLVSAGAPLLTDLTPWAGQSLVADVLRAIRAYGPPPSPAAGDADGDADAGAAADDAAGAVAAGGAGCAMPAASADHITEEQYADCFSPLLELLAEARPSLLHRLVPGWRRYARVYLEDPELQLPEKEVAGVAGTGRRTWADVVAAGIPAAAVVHPATAAAAAAVEVAEPVADDAEGSDSHFLASPAASIAASAVSRGVAAAAWRRRRAVVLARAARVDSASARRGEAAVAADKL